VLLMDVWTIPIGWSLGVIGAILASAVAASWVRARRVAPRDLPDV
jgi:hypothetical protein